MSHLIPGFPHFVRPWDFGSGMAFNAQMYSHTLGSSFTGGNSRAYTASPQVVRPRSADDDTRSETSSDQTPESPAAHRSNGGDVGGVNSSPLDALFALTNKPFDEARHDDKNGGEHMCTFIDRARSCMCVSCPPLSF